MTTPGPTRSTKTSALVRGEASVPTSKGDRTSSNPWAEVLALQRAAGNSSVHDLLSPQTNASGPATEDPSAEGYSRDELEASLEADVKAIKSELDAVFYTDDSEIIGRLWFWAQVPLRSGKAAAGPQLSFRLSGSVARDQRSLGGGQPFPSEHLDRLFAALLNSKTERGLLVGRKTNYYNLLFEDPERAGRVRQIRDAYSRGFQGVEPIEEAPSPEPSEPGQPTSSPRDDVSMTKARLIARRLAEIPDERLTDEERRLSKGIGLQGPEFLLEQVHFVTAEDRARYRKEALMAVVMPVIEYYSLVFALQAPIEMAAERVVGGLGVEEAAAIQVRSAQLAAHRELAASISGREAAAQGVRLAEARAAAPVTESTLSREAGAVGQELAATAAQPAVVSGQAQLVRGWARVSESAMAWLEENGLTERARASLAHAGDDIVSAVNRFHGVSGFDEVIRAYLAGGNAQEGARFVMRFANANFNEGALATMAFEMPGLRKVVGTTTREVAGAPARQITQLAVEPTRYLDLWAHGTKYEFKSVRELAARLVTGPKAGTFGQLQKDLIAASAGETAQGFLAELKRLRWVFNSEKMAQAGLTRGDVVARLGDELFSAGIFRYHPMERQIRIALDDIVVFWP